MHFTRSLLVSLVIYISIVSSASLGRSIDSFESGTSLSSESSHVNHVKLQARNPSPGGVVDNALGAVDDTIGGFGENAAGENAAGVAGDAANFTGNIAGDATGGVAQGP